LGRSEKAEANRWERKKIERKKKGGDKIEERERERERERVECTQVLMLGRNKFKCV